MSNLVTCNKCNWVSFGVTREFAEAEVKQFNEYFDGLTVEKQELYYGGQKSSAYHYTCLVCGGSSFRPSIDGDCPQGCTINPVIVE